MFANHYQVIEPLSRGGMGVVYRVFDTRMKREVAIKRLLPLRETRLNEKAPASLVQEASALAKFQHPNIVTIHSFEEDEEGPYVVMEMIEGACLQSVIEEGAVAVEDFEEIAFQLLDALVAAQDLKVLHRDIKPSNIMVRWLPSGRTQFKILDFGLSKFSLCPQKQTVDCKGHFLGSVDYLAPEQLEQKELDQRVDLYSLGCVLYFALTQRPPFAGGSLSSTIINLKGNLVTDIRDLRPDLPEAVAAWLMNMIKNRRARRPADSRSALKAFENALTPEEEKIALPSHSISGSSDHNKLEIENEAHYDRPDHSADSPATEPVAGLVETKSNG